MPLGDRLTLLQQDRELRSERKLREMVSDSQETGVPLGDSEHDPYEYNPDLTLFLIHGVKQEKAKCPKERVILSSATQRSLDRKKRYAELKRF